MNKTPSRDFTNLWNDLPQDERVRLMPHMIETQAMHIWQVKKKIIAAHEGLIKELNDWEANLMGNLDKIKIQKEDK